MRLSVCIIVKNEQNTIERCLKSLHEIRSSCEIIVVDTGSTDKTLKILKKEKVNLFQQKWDDDFSKPRNLAISKAIGKWILMIDADETLRKECIPELEEIINTEPAKTIYTVQLVSVMKNPTVKKKLVHDSKAARLYPNDKKLKYVLRVHEQLFTGKAEFEVVDSGIVYDHSGYNVGITAMRKKAERNIRLLKMDEEIYDAGQIYYELAQSYGLLGNYNEATRYFKKAQLFKDLPKEIYDGILEFLSTLAPRHQIKKPIKIFKKRK